MKKIILLIACSFVLTGCSFHPPSFSFHSPFKIFSPHASHKIKRHGGHHKGKHKHH